MSTKKFLNFSLNLLRYKKAVTLANVFCNAVIFSRAAAVSFCIRQILNALEGGQGFALATAAPYLLAFFAIAGIRIAAIMSCAALDALRAYFYQNRLRMNILNRLLKKRDITSVAGHSGAIFETLNHDVPIATFPAELLTEVTGHFIFTLIALTMLLSISWRLTLFIFLPLSAAIYGIQRLSERMKERRQKSRLAEDRATGFVGDVVDAAIAIKATGAEDAVLERFAAVNGTRRKAALKDALLNAKIGALLNASVYIGSAIIMFAAGQAMAGGVFGLGDFSLFVAHLGTLADCVNRIVELVAESRRAEVSYERIVAVAGDEAALSKDAGIALRRIQRPHEHTPKGEAFTSFEVNNLCFDYGDGNGFSGVSFELHTGELVAVAGEVGSGKSTLLSVLMGMMAADSGEMLWNGRSLSALPSAGAPQRSGFFSKSLKENLCLGLPAGEREILSALSVAALHPLQGDTDVGHRGDKLSGGQRQRLSLARMLLRDAPLLIIDDCVSALDGETKEKVLQNLLNYLKQSAHGAIIATNEPAFIEAADRVVYMERGKVVSAT